MSLSSRTVRFNLSPALAAVQGWAVEVFPAIVQRATGHSERWRLVERSVDAEGAPAWEYAVQGLPEIDLVVDHIIHELTDAVLTGEEHTVTSDVFTFGSMRRDRPGRPEEPAAPDTEQLIGGEER